MKHVSAIALVIVLHRCSERAIDTFARKDIVARAFARKQREPQGHIRPETYAIGSCTHTTGILLA